jgi:hypothetical protein
MYIDVYMPKYTECTKRKYKYLALVVGDTHIFKLKTNDLGFNKEVR